MKGIEVYVFYYANLFRRKVLPSDESVPFYFLLIHLSFIQTVLMAVIAWKNKF